MNYRPATLEDAQLLLRWRNDPLTRAMSRNADQVSLSRHLAWLCDRLTRPHFYIAERNRIPVGTFRIDGNEVSYTIAPEHRRRGLATELLKMVHADFGPLRAEIFEHNEASIKAAMRAGHIVHILELESA